MTRWGRLIFYVADVDALWKFEGLGFDPEIPRDASWGERYFHMPDPDGHELVCPGAPMKWKRLRGAVTGESRNTTTIRQVWIWRRSAVRAPEIDASL